jgi:hypothetical protein
VARRAPKCPMALQDDSKNPHRRNSFRLTFGTEAFIPVEINLTSFKTNEYGEGNNDNHLPLNLDLLDEACNQAEAKTRAYQQRKTRYHDRRMKHREFKVGDLVLRKVTFATKNPTQDPHGRDHTKSSSSTKEALITLRS